MTPSSKVVPSISVNYDVVGDETFPIHKDYVSKNLSQGLCVVLLLIMEIIYVFLS